MKLLTVWLNLAQFYLHNAFKQQSLLQKSEAYIDSIHLRSSTKEESYVRIWSENSHVKKNCLKLQSLSQGIFCPGPETQFTSSVHKHNCAYIYYVPLHDVVNVTRATHSSTVQWDSDRFSAWKQLGLHLMTSTYVYVRWPKEISSGISMDCLFGVSVKGSVWKSTV